MEMLKTWRWPWSTGDGSAREGLGINQTAAVEPLSCGTKGKTEQIRLGFMRRKKNKIHSLIF